MLRIITGSKAGRGKKRSKQKSSPDIYVKAVPARKDGLSFIFDPGKQLQ